MSKTGWTLTAAAVLIVVAVALGVTRRLVLGPDIEGPRGRGVWRVKVTVTGELGPDTETITTPLPPDFRHQHLSQFANNSIELIARGGRRQQSRRRAITWRRASLVAHQRQPYRLTYSFNCLLGARRPSESMNRVTQLVDAAPTGRRYLQTAPLIESNDPGVRERGRDLLLPLGAASKEERLRALFDFVSGLEDRDESKTSQGARTCLEAGGGDSGGKARLLVALCRSQGINARLITGLILAGSREQSPHYWAEAWLGGRWLPMCPTDHHFGSETFPDNYLVFRTTDQGIVVRGDDTAQFTFQVQALRGVDSAGRPPEATPLRSFLLQRASLFRLRPGEQHLVRFLLLLPLAALIVTFYRTLIGVPTFGTFSPALLGLAFLDLRALRWGLPIFLLIILVGWIMRHGLERFHLLQVPRAAALLTMIVGLLIILIVVSSNFGVTGTQYVALFPLVILTHLVERFWTIEAEDGTMSSFKTLVGTVVVSISVSLALSPEVVPTWMLRYPETLIAVLAIQLALGRYTGYRLSELYRFGELIQDEPPPPAGGVATAHAPQTEKKEGA